jgi:guanylate kinase
MVVRLGPLIIVSGPSGTGKSTIVERLLQAYPGRLHLSVSATTRPPRPREQDGVHYYYWTRQQFEEEARRGGFLEWAEVYGNYYGTLVAEVTPRREKGQGAILDIDTKGKAQVKARCPDAVAIFIRTSSLEEYARRLRSRGTETTESMERRLASAQTELGYAPEYDYQVINDDLETAVTGVRAIIEPLFERKNDAG